MQPKSDAQLLREYAEDGIEASFSELVHRYTNLVYSAALRQVNSAETASEIAQRVFIGLARDARSLSPRLATDASLAGWLCRCARNLSLNFRRDEFRRQTQERRAMEQLISNSDDAPDWERLQRVLDEAMSELNDADYDALVLRFFQNQDFRTIGAAVGVSDDTAQKRVARALKKLRDLLFQRGIRTTAAALTVVITANAVQSAPAGLAAAISAAALLTGTAVTTSTAIALTKTIAMTTLQKALVTVTVAALAGAGIYEAHKVAQLQEQNQTLQQQQTPLAEQIQQLQRERDEATNRVAAVRQNSAGAESDSQEPLKLRGDVGVLQRQATEASEKARIAEEKLAAELSAQTQFAKRESVTVNATKQLGLAVRVFSAYHNDQYPTNMTQLAQELGGKFNIGGIDLFSLEFINGGAERVDHPNMVEFRDRLSRQAPDGTWRRIYGFADGSVQTATSNDGNFEAWEKANTYLPPTNPSQ